MPWNKGVKKPLQFKRLCRVCGESFLSADNSKANLCPPCKKPRPCLCGCGLMASSAAHPHRQGHASRIDSEKMRDGHRRQAAAILGKNNPSVRSREKLSEALTVYWSGLTPKQKKRRVKNHLFVKSPLGARYKRVDGYRSKLELRVVRKLQQIGIPFEYEKCYRFQNGKRFYPDFTLEGPLLIEVSGFAYESWKKQFVEKVKRIVEEGHRLVCVTYPDKVAELRRRVSVPVCSPKGLRKCLSELLPES